MGWFHFGGGGGDVGRKNVKGQRKTRGSARKNEAQLDSQFTIPRSCQSVSTYTQAFGFKSGISYTNVI